MRMVIDGTIVVDLHPDEDIPAIRRRVHDVWTGRLSRPTAQGIDPASALLTVRTAGGGTLDVNLRVVKTILFDPA